MAETRRKNDELIALAAKYPEMFRNIGADHIMLGSDYPQFTLRQSVDAIESLDLDRGEKDRILYETARKLLTPKLPD